MTKSLDQLVQVIHGNGEYSSKLISLVDVQPGALVTKIEGAQPASNRAYTSVQVSEDADIELNSNLVFCNHSCDPSVVFDMDKFEVRAAAGRALEKGQDMTFFYPSTEWDMQQPFQCQCGSNKCLGIVSGARYLDDAVLGKYELNPHIQRLLAKRAKDGVTLNGGRDVRVDSVQENN